MSLVTASTHIQTDNTLSGITAFSSELSGNQHLFTLSEAQGQIAGSNLFYSFSQFNIGSGDTAWFNLNTPDLTHIISRVTGGNESFINGELKVTNAATGSTPSFFFINPSGVTLGPGASIDVPGSFYASTASSLHFSDGSQYQTNDSSITSSLSAAPPESFGFLGNEAGSLNLSGTEADPVDLSFRPLSNVGFVANNIHIEQANISSKDNKSTDLSLEVISIGNQPVSIDINTPPASEQINGNLSIYSSSINLSGNRASDLAIKAGNIRIEKSELIANSSGNSSMSDDFGINVSAQSDLELNNSVIASNAIENGNGGSIYLSAANINLLNGGQISTLTKTHGDTGNITVIGDKILIQNQQPTPYDFYTDGKISGTGIFSITDNGGKPGSISVITNALSMKGNNAIITTDSFGQNTAGDIQVEAKELEIIGRSYISSDSFREGNAGPIKVNADRISLLGQGGISSSTYDQGNAGSVTITAKEIFINGYLNGGSGGIASDAYPGSNGSAGSISVAADKISLINDGSISSFSASRNEKATASRIQVFANTLDLHNGGRIVSQTLHTGNAGDLLIAGLNSTPANPTSLNSLHITNGSVINATSYGEGNAGNITINTEQLIIDRQDNQRFTGILAQSDGIKGSGNISINTNFLSLLNEGGINTTTFSTQAGASLNFLIINAKNLNIASGGYIETNTAGKGNAGNVIVNAEKIEISGLHKKINDRGEFYISYSRISSEAESNSKGNAGSAEINTKALTITDQGRISNSTFSKHGSTAGAITINTGSLEINNGYILSSAEENSKGEAGTIKININNHMLLNNKAKIGVENETTSSSFDSATGNIDINLFNNSSLYLDDSTISTRSSSTDGSSINIKGNNTIWLRNSPIIASVSGLTGNGGNINLASNLIILDTGFIQANTNGLSANGGKITISESSVIIPSSNYLLIGGNQEDFMPFSGRNVIQAVAPNGQSVPPILKAPQLNLSGLLTHLSVDSIDTNHMSPNTCLINDHSSLQRLGRGGQPLRSHHYLLTSW